MNGGSGDETASAVRPSPRPLIPARGRSRHGRRIVRAMADGVRRFRFREQALLGFILFAFATVVYSVHLLIFHRLHGSADSWLTELTESAVHWAAWLVVLPAILWTARRVPLRLEVFALSSHAVASIAVTIVQIAIRAAMDQTLIHHERTLAALEDGFVATFARTFFGGLISYWGFIIVRAAILHERDQREAAAIRDRQLAIAQLAVLQNQLQPHFLFNALNGIASLMHQDVPAANRMLLRLSSLLRALLDENGAPEISLAREQELLCDYVAVEQARLAERLRFRLEIAPEMRRAVLPRLLLQPLVENAIRHGISPRREGGAVDVMVAPAGAQLRIEVRNDGRLGPADSGSGVGLRNCRSRLEQLYGNNYTFRLDEDGAGRVCATVELPLRHSTEPA